MYAVQDSQATQEACLHQDDSLFYDVKDLQRILKVSRSTAYELVRIEGFPSIKIGNAIRIPKDRFQHWVSKCTNTTRRERHGQENSGR